MDRKLKQIFEEIAASR